MNAIKELTPMLSIEIVLNMYGKTRKIKDLEEKGSRNCFRML